MRKVIFNQGAYLTFRGFDLNSRNDQSPYTDPTVLATLVVSDDSKFYLRYAYPHANVVRIRYSINPALYFPESKKNQIAYMPRKQPEEIEQLLNLLGLHGALEGYKLTPIHNQSEGEAARILRESLVFFSFVYQEGFSLPTAEALACGCIMIGYHGRGGREFLKPEFSFPIDSGDIIEFAHTASSVLHELRQKPDAFSRQTALASAFIHQTYSIENEENDILTFWNEMFG